jgi:Tfp pilus tip-associated adhesin PilY1
VLPTSGTLVSQTLDTSVDPRTIPNPVAVDWTLNNGWYVPLPVGERVNVDLKLQLGTLVALSNTPNDNYCTIGGTSMFYALNYKSGAPLKADKSVGYTVGNPLSTGMTLIRLPTHKLAAIVTEADTTVQAMSVPVANGAAGSVRRVGWRELN